MGSGHRLSTEAVTRNQNAAEKMDGVAAPEQQKQAPRAFPGSAVGRGVAPRRLPWPLLSLTRLRMRLYTNKMKFTHRLATPVAVEVGRSNRMSTASRKETRLDRQAA